MSEGILLKKIDRIKWLMKMVNKMAGPRKDCEIFDYNVYKERG